MTARVLSAALVGVDAVPVGIEVDLLRRLPSVVIVGLPSASARESAERVRSAILAAGFEFPRQRIVVSVAPADLRKVGTALDLGIAVGILRATDQIPEVAPSVVWWGELSLAGEVRPVRGALAAAALGSAWVGSEEQAGDVARVARVPAVGLRPLADLRGGLPAAEVWGVDPPRAESRLSLSDVRGQSPAVLDRLGACAATRRPVVLRGPPGCGKTMVAARLPALLGPLPVSEARELARIQDCAGLRGTCAGGVATLPGRPFRAPHHTVSVAGLVGGASLRPGEATLAHRGVLYLDDYPEFPRASREVLRAVREDREVRIHRSGGSVVLPADAWIVASVLPCPCGRLGHPARPCLCSPESRERYAGRWVGDPLLEGAEVIDLSPVPPSVLLSDAARWPEWPVWGAS